MDNWSWLSLRAASNGISFVLAVGLTMAVLESPALAGRRVGGMCVKTEAYLAAERNYKIGIKALAARDWKKANSLLSQGIRELGDSYLSGESGASNSVIDDSGQALSGALYEHLLGHPSIEANLRKNTLGGRLERYRIGHRCIDFN